MGDDSQIGNIGLMLAAGMFLFSFVFLFSLFGKVQEAAGTTTGGGGTTAATCGQKGAAEKPPSLNPSQCSTPGPTTPVISSNGFYARTSFGCGGPESEWDPPSADNCIGRCASLKSITKMDGTVIDLPAKDSSPRGNYQSKVEYFAANMDQYKCGTFLKITDPKSGKAVVVVVIDRGPYCGSSSKYGDMQVNGKPMKIDISNAASDAIDSADTVKVEQILGATPLQPVGPLPVCTTSSGAIKLSCLINQPILLNTEIINNLVRITG